MSKVKFFRPRAAQAGAVLVTGLVFLVVLTMFVLALVRSGTLEERMARNARDQQVAREAAEAMLRDAEAVSFSKPPFDPYDSSQFSKTCKNGLCLKPVVAAGWDKLDWKDASLTRGFSKADQHVGKVSVQPRYIIEMITAPVKVNTWCEPGIARITARGEGNGGAVAFLQTTIRYRPTATHCD
ncbi:hypothetical protein HF313_20660 [Massilia atriviolacea]|uniref:Type 4 fimbrial biogenesis protein PilX N-terminal domain-containing protein n=1 Tax=Massilia atriviolacea TaxID=2495579 RepID=A0A430HRX5_9BURK|nr:PilX N-terminal domain-containing pilus assembly protein [Massilia atriviolacea]RSZ60295.1 hypothetical protein EJB06_04040 [Massilia atriviolacea]